MDILARLPAPLRRRAVGLVYLLYFVIAFLGAGLKNHWIIVASDVVYVVVTVLFFLLLRHVNVTIAILATACSLAGQALAVFFNQTVAGLVVDGLFLLLLGFLWYRSRLIPRPIAVLVAIAGAGWLTFAIPGFVSTAGVVIEVIGAIAEVVLMLWLLVRGVDVTPTAALAPAAPART